MASRGRGAKQKGASFEREIADFLSKALKIEFKRGLGQARAGGKEIADVTCKELPQIHFELKRQKRPNIKAAYAQACNDAPSKLKIIITKQDREDTLVTMELSEWLELFKAYVDGVA